MNIDLKRSLQLTLLATSVLAAAVLTPLPAQAQGQEPAAAPRTRAERDAMTPDQVLQSFKAGNARFVKGDRKARNLLAEQQATATGQHPAAIVLSCIDSRAPAEFVFDKGIGEIFNARIAGNVLNPDIAGSMEFACAAAGAKLIVVLGHSRCGAISGAIDHVELGNLTGLLERVHPAIEATDSSFQGPHRSDNSSYVEAVTRSNVELTVAKLRRISPILRSMEEEGKIKIVAALYNVTSGQVEFIEVPAASH